VKAYLITTGAAFGLLAVLHVARLAAEGAYLLTEPIFLITTLGSIGLCVWAVLLLKGQGRPGS
jgi:hypothetical protein